MAATTIIAIILIVILAGIGYMFYTGQGLDSIPVASESLGNLESMIDVEPEFGEGSVSLVTNGTKIDYATLVPNPRWNHMPLTVYMDTGTGEGLASFGDDDIDYVRHSLKIWEEKTDGVISFDEVDSVDEADIVISWFASLTEIEEGRVVGEGGPTRAIDTGGFYTLIEGGEIFLIPTDNKCVGINRPVHEMGHVLGLGHAPAGYGDVMFSKEISCRQNITQITIDAITELYKIPASSDLTITNVSAVKKGGLLDMNFTVRNVGLKDSVQTSMSFVGDGEEIDSLKVPKFSVIPRIEPGSGVSMMITNVRVSSSLSEIVLKVDSANSINEMFEKNNEATVKFKS